MSSDDGGDARNANMASPGKAWPCVQVEVFFIAMSSAPSVGPIPASLNSTDLSSTERLSEEDDGNDALAVDDYNLYSPPPPPHSMPPPPLHRDSEAPAPSSLQQDFADEKVEGSLPPAKAEAFASAFASSSPPHAYALPLPLTLQSGLVDFFAVVLPKVRSSSPSAPGSASNATSEKERADGRERRVDPHAAH